MMENGIVMAENQHSADAYKLLLDISRAANSQLELPAVLRSVARCLDPRVRLDGIAVVSMDGDRLRPHWLYSVHTVVSPGDSFQTVASRVLDVPLTKIDHRVPRFIPFPGSAAEHMIRSGRPIIRRNLETERGFPEEEFM